MGKEISRRDFTKLISVGALGLTIPSYVFGNIFSQTNIKIREFVENAREYLGAQYRWGGRLTKKYPGLDCLGLLFLAHSKTFDTRWYDFSVYPSEIVEKNQLGKPVKGLDGVLSKDLNFSNLKEGDIIYLLSESKINDEPLANIQGKDYWPRHTGMYSNKKKDLFLEASPFIKKVVESNFKRTLENDPKSNKAVFVTRLNF